MLIVKNKSFSCRAKVTVIAATLCSLLFPACGFGARVPEPDVRYRALVFTKTTGFRHDSIPAGVEAIEQLGRRHGFAVDTTADAGAFTARRLARYRVVVFLSATGTPLARASEQRALERFIRSGGGWVGIHAASDTRGRWPWYEGLVGTRFDRHDPGVSTRTVRLEDRTSAATRGLPARWRRTDEWYRFRANPRGRVHVLAALDEARPLAWCHRYDGGRAVYTAMGHTTASFAEAGFLSHLHGAIEMGAGTARFDCAP
jgi:type 1 glutamine amidotransferase